MRRVGERRHRVSRKLDAAVSRWDSGRRASPTGLRSLVGSALRKHQLGQPMVTYRPTEERGHGYRPLAQAHQALRSGRPEVVWSTPITRGADRPPRLYTWDSARSITDELADGWQYVRGWHNELAVTPDYETAALLLLLQQDMLAYVDETAAVPSR